MATIPEILLKEALEILEDLIACAKSGDPEIATIKYRKSQIKGALHTVHLAVERLSGYQPLIGGKLQCPNCWACDGVHSPLTPIPGTDDEDFFRCHMCDYKITTPSI